MAQQKHVHWYPGHMVRAIREIEEKMSIVDVVIEILDARAPLSSRNPYLADIRPEKQRLLILAKSDLADEKVTYRWVKFFQDQRLTVLALNLESKFSSISIAKKAEQISTAKREKEIRKGMKPQPIRAMIIGIPNVGKSTLINKLAHHASAAVENRPGLTKAQQWIKVGTTFELLDTPGILPPDYDNAEAAMHLAAVGSIKQEILPIHSVVDFIVKFLRDTYPDVFTKLYGLKPEDLVSLETILSGVAKRRGLLTEGQPDMEKAELVILKEFRSGALGRISLEKPML